MLWQGAQQGAGIWRAGGEVRMDAREVRLSLAGTADDGRFAALVPGGRSMDNMNDINAAIDQMQGDQIDEIWDYHAECEMFQGNHKGIIGAIFALAVEVAKLRHSIENK